MTNKSDEKECGCPKCREARGETFNGVTREERARITHEEFAPILAKHGVVTAEMLDVLAKMNGHKTRDMGNDFALALLSGLMSFIDTVSKPGTPQSAKYELFDMFVKHARGQLQSIDSEDSGEIPPGLRAILEGLGIDLDNVKVVSVEG